MDSYTKIYMVGIKGFGMSSLAALLKKMGKQVFGSDVQTREPADVLLENVDIKPLPFGLENITLDIDLVITTGSHGGLKNPEVLKAQDLGIPVMTHAEALGKVMDQFEKRVAVCGTHGKTTVSALLAYLMMKLNIPCGYQVGAPSFSGLPGGDYTGNTYFIVESDEYVASPGVDNTPRFMFQNPTHTICMNIEHDHVDVYKDIEDTKIAFRAFFEKLPDDGALIYCAEDMHVREVVALVQHVPSYGYGMSDEFFTRVLDISVASEVTRFSLIIDGKHTGEWETRLSGEHNVLNISGVITFLYLQGFDLEDIKKHLITFTGSKRRFEHVYEDTSYTLIDDYAHHPSEIRETLKGVKMTYPDRRIIVFFQPHTFSRTEAFKKEFIEALSIADQAYILDIYASAREVAATDSITSQDLVMLAHDKGYSHIKYLSTSDAYQTINSVFKPGDVIMTMGATDVFKLHNAIIDVITSRKAA